VASLGAVFDATGAINAAASGIAPGTAPVAG
jgi:hypothetical protein